MEQHPTVLHLIGSLDAGGTERQLVELIRRASAPERHVVAVFSRPGELAPSLPRPPVLLASVDRAGMPSAARAATALRRLVRSRRPDLVHAHLAHAEVLASVAVPRGIPIVASRRGRTPLFEVPLIGRLMLETTLRRERLIVCNSNDLARRARRDNPHRATVVIPNGVDCSWFAPSKLPGGPPTVVVVARLRAQKAHDRFLRAFRMVRNRVPDARAVLVGDGPLRTDLERLNADLGLQGVVRFVGAVTDTRPYLAEATVAALTSPYEGLPNALLEAMACGRPVVATDVGGVSELVADGREGLLVEPSDQAVAEALVEVLTDPPSAARMGAAARTRAETFDWSRTVARTEAAYRSIVGQRVTDGDEVAVS